MKRYPARAPKNYAWITTNFVLNYNDATVGVADLLLGATLAVSLRQQARVCNIKRIIMDHTLMVHTNDLEDETLAGVWGVAGWAVLLVDEDDTTVYDPITGDIQDETVLLIGATDRIGWGTVPAISTSQSQSAAFMASTRWTNDIRSNRRMSNDQKLVIHATRHGQASYNRLGDHDFIHTVLTRILIQLPGT